MDALSFGMSPTLETRKLFERWRQSRDPRAREMLVDRFMPLARKLARRYAGRETLDDLIQVASLGLLKAIDRFEPSRGTAFTSLAVPTILGELKRYFRDVGWFAHVPRGVQELALRVQQAERTLSARTGRSPTAQDIANYLELDVEEVLDALCAIAAHRSVSLDAPMGDGDEPGDRLAETFGEEDERYERVEAAATIAGGLRSLSKVDRQVLIMYYLEELTQVQVAAEIGVSQMQVSRILRRATRRLQELTTAEGPFAGR